MLRLSYGSASLRFSLLFPVFPFLTFCLSGSCRFLCSQNHIRHLGIQCHIDAVCFFGRQGRLAPAINYPLGIDAGSTAAGEAGEYEPVVASIEQCEGEAELIPDSIERVVINQPHTLERFQLHIGQKFLLVQHTFGCAHHIPELLYFRRQLPFYRNSIMTIHEVMIFLIKPVQLSSQDKYLSNQNNQQNDYNAGPCINQRIQISCQHNYTFKPSTYISTYIVSPVR